MSIMGNDVAEVSASLVREYLSRKGLKKTIACMDEELPRTQSSINNRSDLRKILHLEGLYKMNKVEEQPLKSLLEMIVKDRIKEAGKGEGHWESFHKALEHSKSNSSRNVPVYVSGDNIFIDNLVSDSLRFTPSSTLSQAITQSEKTQKRFTALPESENDAFKLIKSHGLPLAVSEGSFAPEKKVSDTDSLKNRSSKMRRGIMMGPISSSSQESNRKRSARKAPSPGAAAATEDCLEAANWTISLSTKDEQYKVSAIVKEESNNPNKQIKDQKRPERMLEAKHLKNCSAPSPKLEGLHVLEMVLDDIENEESFCNVTKTIQAELRFERTSIDQVTAIALREIIFGSPMACFSDEWKQQSFSFSDVPGLTYGIVQKKGGPCGVLAAVQACVLQKLLFEEASSTSPDERLEVSKVLRTKCLCQALRDMLWRAGSMKRAAVAINTGRSLFTPIGRYKTDGILETISYVSVETLDDLTLILEQNIRQFESGPFGCILLTISAILSRTIANVQGDMDVPTSTLIGAHGYCTQELVNLLLCGRSVSNVFDDEMRLDSGNGNFTLLKGIKSRSNIGFLSLFEHYSICKIGVHLKNPKFPIWLVCSESHFSVLFSISEDLITNPCREEEFDLYYYDGLANQQEPIRLTIYLHSAAKISHGDNTEADLIPPLELCIRTKWRNAEVCWNETEPIL